MCDVMCVCMCSRDSKLTMLLRESLGNMNCRTTMIAHISASPSNFSDTLSTIQIASRLLRMKKKKTKVSMVGIIDLATFGHSIIHSINKSVHDIKQFSFTYISQFFLLGLNF